MFVIVSHFSPGAALGVVSTGQSATGVTTWLYMITFPELMGLRISA